MKNTKRQTHQWIRKSDKDKKKCGYRWRKKHTFLAFFASKTAQVIFFYTGVVGVEPDCLPDLQECFSGMITGFRLHSFSVAAQHSRDSRHQKYSVESIVKKGGQPPAFSKTPPRGLAEQLAETFAPVFVDLAFTSGAVARCARQWALAPVRSGLLSSHAKEVTASPCSCPCSDGSFDPCLQRACSAVWRLHAPDASRSLQQWRGAHLLLHLVDGGRQSPLWRQKAAGSRLREFPDRRVRGTQQSACHSLLER